MNMRPWLMEMLPPWVPRFDTTCVTCGERREGLRQPVLRLGHGRHGGAARALGVDHQQAGVLDREEALRDRHRHPAGRADGGEEGDPDQEAQPQRPVEQPAIAALEGPEAALQRAVHQPGAGARRRSRVAISGVRVSETTQEASTASGHGGGEGVEHPPHHAAHEQDRQEHRGQRQGDGDDGEADLARAADRRLQRRHALLDVAHDRFQHHDGVVHHQADRDGEAEQGDVVDAVAQRVHQPEGGAEADRHRDGRDQGGGKAAEEQEADQHHQPDRDDQALLHIVHRGADRDASGRA